MREFEDNRHRAEMFRQNRRRIQYERMTAARLAKRGRNSSASGAQGVRPVRGEGKRRSGAAKALRASGGGRKDSNLRGEKMMNGNRAGRNPEMVLCVDRVNGVSVPFTVADQEKLSAQVVAFYLSADSPYDERDRKEFAAQVAYSRRIGTVR